MTGRVEETIFRHAISAPIRQLETIIEGHPKVHRAVVIGLPAGRGEDEIICAVVMPEGEPVSELHEHMRDAGVAELNLPERLELVAELPVTLTGKIRKVELKKRYAAG